MKEKLQKIHEASMEMLEKVGMKFHHPEAVEILKAHGIRMEGNVAHFTEDQLMYWVRKAPSRFTIYARNPKHNVVIGGDNVVVAPGYGCPTITLPDGTKRDGTIEDYVNYAKLFHANEDYHVDGGLMIQPNDIDIPTSVLAMFYSVLTHSDKALMVSTGKREYMEAMMECLAEVFGGKEALKAYPRICTIMNINTPLQLDVTMTDVLITLAKYGQPFVAANCAMAGSTSPATLAGTMAMTNAEILSCIALTQMINPGTPVIYASQTTTADMRTGQIACGSPEGALCYKYTANLAKFYGLPCRGGGAVTDSKVVDTQSGYESMLTLMADFSNNMNLVIHSAGILDGYNSTSYEKVIQDFEIVRYVKRYFRDIEVNDETIPMDLIEEVGHDGEFLTKEHTFKHCRTEALAPTISNRGTVADPLNQIHINIQKRYEQLMDAYVQPEMDAEVLNKVKNILANVGVSRELLDKIETM
ncbi:MAG: trimethylamine methyltransferase family protein [Firmicutes bacterium]|nr:trimethylamine methyltransferase family protein [Bacillota bacterium]MBQ6810056.1 trimethylamine methyltransferase family protein [Bacillota bacterium]